MKTKQEIFGNNGSIDEQVGFQKKIQGIGLNLVSCCNCDAVFFHRTGIGIVDTIICPFCKVESDPCNFGDYYYNGMHEQIVELDKSGLK